MYNAGLVPERCSDPSVAFDLYGRDGAVILTVDDITAEGMLGGVEAIFGDHLIGHQGFTKVSANADLGADTYYDAKTRTVHANTIEQLGLHIDAYMAFGDYYPDLNVLLCAVQAPSGGENFLVDGRRLVDGIDHDADEQDLSEFVWNTIIEQSRPRESGPKGTNEPLIHRRPIASLSDQSRFSARYHEHQRLLDDEPADPADLALLARWDEIVRREGDAAARFALEPGDLLVLDNYRVFHGREPYVGTSRLLHKLWAWTDLSFGLPDSESIRGTGRSITNLEVSR